MVHSVTPSLKKKTIHKTEVLIKGIAPFLQLPPLEDEKRLREAGQPVDSINGCDLFSLFTADIIKEEVLFVR